LADTRAVCQRRRSARGFAGRHGGPDLVERQGCPLRQEGCCLAAGGVACLDRLGGDVLVVAAALCHVGEKPEEVREVHASPGGSQSSNA
jgi:hypothetical protein